MPACETQPQIGQPSELAITSGSRPTETIPKPARQAAPGIHTDDETAPSHFFQLLRQITDLINFVWATLVMQQLPAGVLCSALGHDDGNMWKLDQHESVKLHNGIRTFKNASLWGNGGFRSASFAKRWQRTGVRISFGCFPRYAEKVSSHRSSFDPRG